VIWFGTVQMRPVICRWE